MKQITNSFRLVYKPLKRLVSTDSLLNLVHTIVCIPLANLIARSLKSANEICRQHEKRNKPEVATVKCNTPDQYHNEWPKHRSHVTPLKISSFIKLFPKQCHCRVSSHAPGYFARERSSDGPPTHGDCAIAPSASRTGAKSSSELIGKQWDLNLIIGLQFISFFSDAEKTSFCPAIRGSQVGHASSLSISISENRSCVFGSTVRHNAEGCILRTRFRWPSDAGER